MWCLQNLRVRVCVCRQEQRAQHTHHLSNWWSSVIALLLIIFFGTGVCLYKMSSSLSTVSGETNLCSHLPKHRRWQSGLDAEDQMNPNEGCQQDRGVRWPRGKKKSVVLVPATWTRSAVVTFLGLGPILKVSAGPKTLQREGKTKLERTHSTQHASPSQLDYQYTIINWSLGFHFTYCCLKSVSLYILLLSVWLGFRHWILSLKRYKYLRSLILAVK